MRNTTQAAIDGLKLLQSDPSLNSRSQIDFLYRAISQLTYLDRELTLANERANNYQADYEMQQVIEADLRRELERLHEEEAST